MPLEIRIVGCTNEQEEFLNLRGTVYTHDPFHVPAAESFPTEGAAFIAYDERRPVARCCARQQTGEPTVGTIGSFEALQNQPAVTEMLTVAAQWLKEQGAQRVLGPMDGDTWHPYRFNTGPFEAAPFIKEPWNPPYYPALWEAAGFAVIETYDSYSVDDAAAAATSQLKFFNRCLRNGFTFQPITAGNYDELLPIIHEISCEIFRDNVLYTPVDLATFMIMYGPARPLLKTGLSWVAFAPDATPAGYVFTYPDYTAALRAMNGKSGLSAKLCFLMNKRKATRTCLKTLGVTQDTRGSGLTAALTHLAYQNSAVLGYRQTLMCLMHSSNDSHRFGGNIAKPFRSYALYELMP